MVLTFKGKVMWCILGNVYCNYLIDCLASIVAILSSNDSNGLNHLNPWLQAQWVCDVLNGLFNYHNVLETE